MDAQLDLSAEYQRAINEANPNIAFTTHDGHPLTIEESLFIHYIVAGFNAPEAFKKAGFKLPRQPLSEKERLQGITSSDKAVLVDKLLAEDGEHPIDKYENNQQPAPAENEEEEEYNQYLNQLTIEDIPEEERKQSILFSKKYLYPDNSKDYTLALYHSAHSLYIIPAIQREITYRLNLVKDAQIADAKEVYRYFTAVMRGQVRDQFGLEASLQDRTRAAECLAKRLIDLPQKIEASLQNNTGTPIQIVIQPRKEEVIEGDFREE